MGKKGRPNKSLPPLGLPSWENVVTALTSTLLILTPFVFDPWLVLPESMDRYYIPKDTFALTLVLFLVTAYLVRTVYGLRFSSLQRGALSTVNRRLSAWLSRDRALVVWESSLVLFGSLGIISTLISTAPHLSRAVLPPLLLAILFYFVLTRSLGRERLRTLLEVQLCVSAVVGFHCLLQYFGQEPLAWFVEGTSPVTRGYRATSYIGQTMHVGAYLAYSIPVGLALAWEQSATRGKAWPELCRRVVRNLAVCFAFFGLLVTGNRGGTIGLFLGLAVLGIFILRCSERPGWRDLSISLILIVGMGICLELIERKFCEECATSPAEQSTTYSPQISPAAKDQKPEIKTDLTKQETTDKEPERVKPHEAVIKPGWLAWISDVALQFPVYQRFRSTWENVRQANWYAEGGGGVLGTRPEYWGIALVMVKDRPVWGMGLGSFSRFLPEYKIRLRTEPDRTTEVLMRAHNEFLQVWAEMGTLAFLIVLMGVSALFSLGIKGTAGLEACPEDNRRACGLIGSLVVVLFTALVGFIFHASSTSFPAIVLAAALVQMAEKVHGLRFTDNRQLTTVNRKLRLGASLLILFLSFLVFQQITAPFRALQQENRGDVLLLALGRVQNQEQRGLVLQAAERSFQQALAIYPYSVTAYYGLGFVALFRQDFPAAIAIFKESLTLQPTAEAYVNLGGAYLGAGKYEKAREMLEASLYIKSTGAARSFLTRLAQIQEKSGE